MTSLPPIKKSTQSAYKAMNLRLPPDLSDAIRQAAERNGRSANAEIIARLQENDNAVIRAELAELKKMLRQVLDQV